MKFIYFYAFIVIILGTLSVSHGDFVTKHRTFSQRFYMNLANQNFGKSLVFSPLSVQNSFALLHQGTQPGSQISKELLLNIYSEPLSVIRNELYKPPIENFQNILKKYENSEQLKISNKIYVDTQAKLKPEFLEIVKENFHFEAENTDLTKGAESAYLVNKWVNNKTNGKIKELIEAKDCNELTRLFLINTIHFKGKWKYPFKSQYTVKKPFWINQNQSINIDMMSIVEDFNVLRFTSKELTHEVDAVEIPYADTDLSMILLIPSNLNKLNEIESNLEFVLKTVKSKFFKRSIILKMPKFKVETTIDLKDVLPLMDIKEVFKGGKLPKLAEADVPVVVSKAIHKAIIEVDEEGIEAGAAIVSLGVQLLPGFALPWVINADRNFVFVIKDSDDNIFFVGRYNGPQ